MPRKGVAGHRHGVADVVEVGEVHLLLAVRGDRDGGNAAVDCAQMHGVQEAVKGVVLELHLEPQLFADGLGQRNIKAVQLKSGIVVLKGWVIGCRAKDNLAGVLDAAPVVRHRGWLRGRLCSLILLRLQPIGGSRSQAREEPSRRTAMSKGKSADRACLTVTPYSIWMVAAAFPWALPPRSTTIYHSITFLPNRGPS